jgi:hypothetical protein
MFELRLEIDQLPKALNKTLNAHWRKQRRLGKMWDLVIESKVRSMKPKEPLKKASISIVRHSHRNLDYDGLVGSMKPVVDALVTAGVLLDDRWSVLGKWNVDQVFRPKKKGPLLEIVVQEVI